MSTLEIKDKIVSKLETIEDASVLENVLNYINDLKNSDSLSKSQLRELEKRSAGYKAGTEKTITWQEIKSELQQNHGV